MNVREFIEILLTVARRRWLVILLPILVFAGLSVLAVKYWPRTYITRTLVMLQEGQAADPLNGGGPAMRRTQLRGAALDTLLKSERVLRGAILDFNLGQKPLTAREFEDEIRSLRKQIFVGVVGQEFIEIELRQAERDGISDRLSIIVTRFLERLFSRQDAIKTARQFALERRKRDLVIAEDALTNWFETHEASISSDQLGAFIKQINGLRSARAEAEKRLVDTAESVIQGPVELTNIVAALAKVRQFPFASSAQGNAPKRSEGMEQLADVFETYEGMNRALVKALRASVASVMQSLKSSPQAFGALHRELKSLAARHEEAVEQYTAHRQQANKSRAPTLPPFGLINPELIRIIDEPKDPASPSTSILKIILACLAAGIGLGVGLAALAEQIDDTLYDARNLSRLTGVDLVIAMPKLDPHSKGLDDAFAPPDAAPT